jgi:O-antigen ligase
VWTAGIVFLPPGEAGLEVNTSRWRVLVNKGTSFLWAALLISLPVTAFPLFPPALGGAALVRPLMVYPLLILLLLATLPHLWNRPLPRVFLPLAAFGIVATISSLLGLFSGLEELRGVSLLERSARNLIVLGIGVALYLTVSLLPRSIQDLRAALRWLYLGMGIALAWGSFQVVYILFYNPVYFNLLNTLQGFISTRRLFTRRVSGLTYEPNWFAEQISFLLIPWLLASVLSGQSVFCWRYRKITVESLLLVWAVIVLIFTYSRAGLGILIALVFVGILLQGVYLSRQSSRIASAMSWVRRLGMVLVVVTALGAVLFAAGSQNNYFSRLWRYWTDPQAGDSFLTYISFSQRIVYWQAAYDMFSLDPVFGIGLGNFAFYFEEMLPDRPLYKTPELLRQIVPEEGRNRLITPKNLHIKVFSETGLVGTATFIAFLIGLAGCVYYLFAQASVEGQFWGFAGALGLVAFLVAAFSYDSFALPNMWVVFGLITAAARVFANQAETT